MKNIFNIIGILGLFALISCGAKPGSPSTAPAPDPSLPSYHYQDAKGNLYDITQQKLIYRPVSIKNTVDGITDEGYYTELNITRNDYAKIAAVSEKHLQRNQNTVTRDPNLPVPFLRREGGQDPKEINVDNVTVNAMNFVLEPYLEDERY